ncbi:methyltransferase, TIGR00027 family [Streptoalloteichus tenebrarius]|uniref:S-adenosyl-L-methionine-dependent methyltransferase n=1 Tax=Streptoalloteichus tenebrarius (strain ATCC 17920 / DSM 40477 / JCM 4838 / CBS 697.72 / NBRC 16177 / NCIMB 11028 / NRRL B-12390 / A12253. 1 / ISP 5477) TaxID=1933 RepID=A0ABT1HTN5_STRSD|nr:SAM-dependent methyltransferase [Streptoalloteichus tenebrarius]MCP2258888.1 methyltransferase, TIGR00027 family [Streptoalloteichus tenebrarius]BFE99427.1 SAM-dependent methyltransferase [Streptoalloteichus tenebrarius]
MTSHAGNTNTNTNTTSQASQTAVMAAAARAAHLLVDAEPRIFADTVAAALLGDRAEELLGYHRVHGAHPILAGARAQAVTRSRYTEDALAGAVRRGVTQYVVLGAGLDSFAYRSALADRLRVFEVDHPATQRGKRDALAAAGIAEPATLTFVPVDFETDSLADQLRRAGFDATRPAMVSWLGVTMYLTREALGQTLAVLGGFAPGSEIIADYILPAEMRDGAGAAYVSAVMSAAADGGEPWLTVLSPDAMSALLEEHGFVVVEHVGQRDSVDAALWERTDALRPAELANLVRARVGERRNPAS